ncbi:MAG: Na+/H+ antiporter NhaA [Prevotella sp.]|nr:Na+/H+ antiporter NhaA [Prevotella sp.]
MREQLQKNIETRLFIPALQFLHREKSSGIVLGVFVVLALVLANSPLSEEYTHFLEHHFGFVINGQPYLNFSIGHWVNDGLMSMFFFVVGLELKREFIGGELRDIRKVTLPVMAAVFGMVFPALFYLLFNAGTAEAVGWGIPMATDIAFALAVVYMLGDRVPVSAKVFLTTLAIVDDLGSVIVIALFYTSQINMLNLALGLAFLVLMFIGNRLGVKNVLFYGLLGIGGVWVSFLTSGIHATISAVLAAMVIPADSRIPEAAFIARIKKLTRQFERAGSNDVRTLEPDQLKILAKVQQDSAQAIPPLQQLEHQLHPFVSFVVMPIFALANAGISFIGMDVQVLFANQVAIGVLCGLLLGKPIGIAVAVWVTEKLGIGRRSRSMTWRMVWGIGCLASIGFTMSMFITMLAFTTHEQFVQAKVGIFVASIIGATVGYLLLRKK